MKKIAERRIRIAQKRAFKKNRSHLKRSTIFAQTKEKEPTRKELGKGIRVISVVHVGESGPPSRNSGDKEKNGNRRLMRENACPKSREVSVITLAAGADWKTEKAFRTTQKGENVIHWRDHQKQKVSADETADVQARGQGCGGGKNLLGARGIHEKIAEGGGSTRRTRTVYLVD